MSSAPFKTGLPVIDKPRFGFPEMFILRAKSREDAEKKIKEVAALESMPAEIRVYHYGFRPNYPVPTAMYFCWVEVNRLPPKDISRIVNIYEREGYPWK